MIDGCRFVEDPPNCLCDFLGARRSSYRSRFTRRGSGLD